MYVLTAVVDVRKQINIDPDDVVDRFIQKIETTSICT